MKYSFYMTIMKKIRAEIIWKSNLILLKLYLIETLKRFDFIIIRLLKAI